MDTSMTRSKRARSISISISSSSTSNSDREGESSTSFHSRSPSPPPPKYHRGNSTHDGKDGNNDDKRFLCVLPPTCSQPGKSTSYSNEIELEKHQNIFHKWICHIPIRDRVSSDTKGVTTTANIIIPESFTGGRSEKGKRWKECLKVFPDERLLNLHHSEVHDPIIKEKKDNGEKIFECFLNTDQCGKKFMDPKKRRRHMIDKHKYPPNYFFSIINHGINTIVQEDGLAMSLIRPRKDPSTMRSNQKVVEQSNDNPKKQIEGNHNHDHHQLSKSNTPDIDMDDLTSKMGKMESSLTFIPRGVRKASRVKDKGMDIEQS
ncbi:uncharacterized protein L201_000451 [Kwoniella dendrophila CBS 6074]|uniref:C2H2-type domain-containing protein n=1 Tax=Kwoniella dendrophila CBS 6074 TaxID=1295534 RepID=A0AAX4JLC1_9TREE